MPKVGAHSNTFTASKQQLSLQGTYLQKFTPA